MVKATYLRHVSPPEDPDRNLSYPIEALGRGSGHHGGGKEVEAWEEPDGGLVTGASGGGSDTQETGARTALT